MARRSDHSREELKELALKSTEELLNEKSASELSTRQIATKMGRTVKNLSSAHRMQNKIFSLMLIFICNLLTLIPDCGN
jgi:hypothetical protein